MMMTLGAVLAGGLHWAMTPRGAGAPTTAPSAGPAAAPSTAAGVDCPEIPADLRTVQRRIVVATLENARAKARRAAREGEPLDWPEDPGPAEPAALREALDDAIEALDDYELLDLDCSEYPCIGVVSAPHHGEANVTSGVRGEALLGELTDALSPWYQQTTQAGPHEDRHDLVVVALATGEAPEGSERRLGGRIDTLAAEWALELEDTGE